MPVSGSYTRHSHWCEIRGGEGECSGDGWKLREGGVIREMEGREPCLCREISKDNPEHICGVEKQCSVMLCLRMEMWRSGVKERQG